MTDVDVFERRFAAAYRRFLDEAPIDVDPAAVAQAVAAARPQARAAWPWSSLHKPTPALAWLALVGLLLLAVGAALLGGSHPQPRAFGCPAGTDPDVPGPVDQARPPTGGAVAMAFDRRAKRVVIVAPMSNRTPARTTWTFDVCTNTWAQTDATIRRSIGAGPLVYDVDSDATLALNARREGPLAHPSSLEISALDLETATWTSRTAPQRIFGAAYDPVSGLVIADLFSPAGGEPPGPSAHAIWSYDVETDVWTLIAERETWAFGTLVAYDTEVSRLVLYEMSDIADGRQFNVRLFDVHAGSWSASATTPPDMNFSDWNYGYCDVCPSGNEIAYDDATQQILIFSYGRMIAYDAATDEWRVLVEGLDPNADARGYDDPTYRFLHAMAYDSVNERLIVYGGKRFVEDGTVVDPDDVLAFDPVAGEWMTLLEASRAGAP